MAAVFDVIYQLMNQLLPFSWLEMTFMKRALLEVLLLAPMCAVMGVIVVNFRLAFFSDAISHSAFTGIAIGVLLGINPTYTMIVFGLLVGLGIAVTKRGSELSTDTVIGVFFSAVVALGIVIISAQKGLTRNLQSYLYGDILAISEGNILGTLLLFLLVLLFIGWGYNRLLLIGLSDQLASSTGIAVRLYEYFFALLLALVVTASIPAVGILLITAMLVIPAAAGRNLARNASQMFWYAVLIAATSAVIGIILSYYWNSATGATIVLLCCGFFILTQIIRLVREGVF